MAQRVPTPEQLDALRDFFRKQPPSTARDFKVAAYATGLTQATAMRAWSRGWPGVAAVEEQLAKERAIAKQSGELLRAEAMVATMKTSAVILQNEMQRLRPAVRALTDNLVASVEDLGGLSPESALKALQRIAKVNKDVAAITGKAIELDRLIAGEATSIVGHRAVEPDAPVNIEVAKATHAALGRAIARNEKAELLRAAAVTGVTSVAVDDASN